MSTDWNAIVVGAGVSGVGCGIAMTHADVDRFVIVDRHEVGASFARWPEEMRFITPSFNSNQFGWLDLNSPGLQLSPAFSLCKEHVSGLEYAKFLKGVVDYMELPVRTGIDVHRVVPLDDGEGFRVETSDGEMRSRFLVWAAGEFQYPRIGGFPGAELCRHSSTVGSWRKLKGDDFVIIGGYESGIDAAIHLVGCGKSVRVLDRRETWQSNDSDPSVSLSPFTQERLNYALTTQRLELFGNSSVAEVTRRDRGGYRVATTDGSQFTTPVPPILATGFDSSLTLVKDLFDWEAGKPKLTDFDESTRTPGLFLAGPQVWHDEVIFCFIYKFRQRFALVVRTIADRLGLDASQFEELYRGKGMYLDDLSCCKDACEAC